LWQAMEKATGITVEDNTFIIGLASNIFNLAGHLTVSEHRNAIETALSQLLGRPIKARIIEGTTLQDWIETKKRDERVAAMRETTYERRERQEAAAQSWDTVYEYVARAYSATPLRQLPQSKARFLMEMVHIIRDAMDHLYPQNPDETTERLLARVIDRVATSAEVSPTVVALELERLREQHKSNTP
ncbi:MAG TPA: hypothetical protein VNJ09_10700, partial [Chthonomonadales bacterium]|nr:hypothetical protein [Chthonomonadales bacterium]